MTDFAHFPRPGENYPYVFNSSVHYHIGAVFFGARAEILLTWNQGVLESRAGPFLGYVKK